MSNKSKSSIKKSKPASGLASNQLSIQVARDYYLTPGFKKFNINKIWFEPAILYNVYKLNTFNFLSISNRVKRLIFVGIGFPFSKNIQVSENAKVKLINIDYGRYNLIIKKLKFVVIFSPPYPEYLYPGNHYPHPFENWRLTNAP